MANIEIKHLKKKFGALEVIGDFSLQVDDREFISLLGPSGCGKSTILRIVAGLEELTSGEIVINDKVVTPLEPKDRDIAMVFQNYALYPHKTVFENLAYGLRIRKTPAERIKKRVGEVSQLLQIDQLLERRPAQLSGGQQQRVAMGRAIMREPAAFLFDEPLSNLDAKLRNHMRVEIRELQQRLGITTLYVTHDQVEAMTMSDRIVVLNHGAIEQIGKPLEIYEKPASLFVATFIGSPSMNLIRLKSDGKALELPSGDRLAVERAPGGEVILGIRPERIKLSGTRSGNSLPYAISLVEELGSQKIIHGRVGDTELTVAFPEDVPLPADGAFVSFPEGHLHFFDTGEGKRLNRGL
ncbi:sn-glycerol-3-phosphate ABC transporter ATP-binding protein UgpC [Mesorhizobium sp. KR9-304]|uniref:ABC transporter ATP-binding protein n=1 Tax=Mesorhizobium sp. KR9-304 TaxID=3156614 RepID=UPI0032B3A2AC